MALVNFENVQFSWSSLSDRVLMSMGSSHIFTTCNLEIPDFRMQKMFNLLYMFDDLIVGVDYWELHLLVIFGISHRELWWMMDI
jgi:hypothetical protein